jgi:hypothetical protein
MKFNGGDGRSFTENGSSSDRNEKQMNFLADIDLDVTVHLGIMKNIDLLSRGSVRSDISLLSDYMMPF